MSFYEWSAESYDVHPIDECVVVCHYNDDDEKIAVQSLSVDEAEEFVKLLQEAIEEAKKSKYYQK